MGRRETYVDGSTLGQRQDFGEIATAGCRRRGRIVAAVVIVVGIGSCRRRVRLIVAHPVNTATVDTSRPLAGAFDLAVAIGGRQYE